MYKYINIINILQISYNTLLHIMYELILYINNKNIL